MTTIITLNAQQKATVLGPVEGADHHDWLAISVPAGVTATTVTAQLTALLDGLATGAALASTLQAAPTVLTPPAMRALLNREVALRGIESRYGLLRSDQLASSRGGSSKNASEYASALRRDGKVIGLPRGGRTMFPAYQFREDGSPIPALAPIIEMFRRAQWSDESIVVWFTAPNGYLDAAEPAAVLASDPARVNDAATSAGADW
jgi:hypothetical protein